MEFWHGFNIDEDISIQEPKGRKVEVKPGRGCGGSMEWIATLKKQRADMNRKCAEQKRFTEYAQQPRFNVMHTSSVMQTERDEQNTVVDDVRRRASKRHVVQTSQKPRKTHVGQSKKPLTRRLCMQPKRLFDEAPNKCLQNAILSLAYDKSAQIHTAFQRMFRASCANGFASGAGLTVECSANIYTTEHAMRYIGA